MIYTALLDPEHRPSILRAILSIIVENGQVDLIGGEAELEKWGKIKYSAGESRPSIEKVFYDLLEEKSDDVIHWFQQIGLARDVTREELQKLSKEEEGKDNGRSQDSPSRLYDFYEMYPIIFDALRAIFALLPSASRLTGQVHGWCTSQQHHDFLNGKLQYLLYTSYEMREERRRKLRKAIATKRAEQGMDKKHTKVKHDDRKSSVMLLGEQLVDLVESYLWDLEGRLPEHTRDELLIKTIQSDGAYINKERLKAKKLEIAHAPVPPQPPNKSR
jgi:hypothetical protein